MGFGVRFLQVARADRKTLKAFVEKQGASAGLESLTRTPLHRKLMRYYYAKIGEAVSREEVVNRLHVSSQMISGPLGDFEAKGLLELQGDQVRFIWSADPILKMEIDNWVLKHGLSETR